MARYELVFKKSVTKDLRGLPKQDVQRILSRIVDLQNDPRPPNCEKLSDRERYRVRQGIYRILYEIDDERVVILVVKVAHRSHAY
jgi:mRNA interferase RelE/StbE